VEVPSQVEGVVTLLNTKFVFGVVALSLSLHHIDYVPFDFIAPEEIS
jgi:hypothetical protein